LLDDSVKGVASWALNSQKVPVSIAAFGFTVVAHDIDNPLQVTGHGMLGNIARPGFPSRRHTLLAHNRLFTDWAAIIKACQLSKAVCMNGMSTGQILRRLSGREHVLSTNRAVVLVLVSEALMRIKDTDGDAHAALGAMTKGFYSTDTAETTLIAVKGFFGLLNRRIANNRRVGR
jgi:hypothetical protein